MKTKTMFFLLIAITLASCSIHSHSIHKRRYTKGWHYGKSQPQAQKEEPEQIREIQPFDEFGTPLRNLREVQNNRVETKSQYTPLAQDELNQLTPITRENDVQEEPCDIIMLKNGDEIEAKVTEIGTSEIKYKQCDNQDGPVFTVLKEDVFKIKYANGTSTLISAIEKKPFLSSSTETKSKNVKILSIVGFSLGALGLGLLWISPVVAIILGAVGMILSISSLILAGKHAQDGNTMFAKGMGVWGIVEGVLVITFAIILLIIL